MEKDIINYENYDGYKTLLKLKENEPGTKYKKKKIIFNNTPIWNSAFFSLIIHAAIIVLDPSLIILMPLTLLGTIAIGHEVSVKMMLKKNLKKFKEDYPNIDIDIENVELQKELSKYEELSMNKDNHMNEELYKHDLKVLDNEFKEKTTTEKIELLKKEIEFWNQVEKQEKNKMKIYYNL